MKKQRGTSEKLHSSFFICRIKLNTFLHKRLNCHLECVKFRWSFCFTTHYCILCMPYYVHDNRCLIPNYPKDLNQKYQICSDNLDPF